MTVTWGLRSLTLCQEVEPYLRYDRQFDISISGPESLSFSVLTCEPERWTDADRGRRTQLWNGMPAAAEESGWTLIHEEYTTYYEWVRRVETASLANVNYHLGAAYTKNKQIKQTPNCDKVGEKGACLSNLHPSPFVQSQKNPPTTSRVISCHDVEKRLFW